MAQLPELCRHRLEILDLKAARGWSLAQTARAFLVEAETIAAWLKRIDEAGSPAVIQPPGRSRAGGLDGAAIGLMISSLSRSELAGLCPRCSTSMNPRPRARRVAPPYCSVGFATFW